ncbi:hypothetical protein [Thiomonas sp.]
MFTFSKINFVLPQVQDREPAQGCHRQNFPNHLYPQSLFVASAHI